MKILVIEDSTTVVEYLRGILESREDVEFLPPAMDGRAGVEAANRLDPDLVLMDLDLPEVHGLEAIRRIMARRPRPIVVLSALLDEPEGGYSFESLRAGAVEVIPKPAGLGPAHVEAFRRELFRVVDSFANHQYRPPTRPPRPPSSGPEDEELARLELVLIGSSTGGLQAIQEILSDLPAPFPLPIVVAHHIMEGFDAGVAAWLGQEGHAVRIVRSGEPLPRTGVLLAPGGKTITLEGTVLMVGPGRPGPQPNIGTLFESASRSYGAGVLAILLSGMGDDGAAELLELRRAGALTIAQSAETCVVDGMPEAARRLGACADSLSPAGMAALLSRVAAGHGARD